MENSPLELYEKAYRLHYVDNDIPRACQVYESLIREFPESNECGYAAIQLQRIATHDLAGRLKTRPGLHPGVAALIALNVVLLIIVAILVVRYQATSSQRARYSSGLSRAMGKVCAGQSAEGRKILDSIKSWVPGDNTALALAADLDKKKEPRRGGAGADAEDLNDLFTPAAAPAVAPRREAVREVVPQPIASPAPETAQTIEKKLLAKPAARKPSERKGARPQKRAAEKDSVLFF